MIVMTSPQSFRFLSRLLAFTLLLSLFASLPVRAALPKLENLFSDDAVTKFLPVSKAFVFDFSQQNNQVVLKWKIADDYYLYQDKIVIKPENAKIAQVNLPQGEPYQDEYFGNVVIYKNALTFPVTLTESLEDAILKVTYQGCAVAGFCYPPETVTVPLSSVLLANNAQQEATSTFTTTTALPSSEMTSLADNWWQPLIFFLLGIGLAFTPCVLPMYPILAGIVLGGAKKTIAKVFSLSMVYVQGMALTYTLLGLVVASAGLQFQAALQHPYVLISISGLFVLLAAAMFGVFSLELPASIQTRLTALSNTQHGGSYRGVFLMGAISGLVCSPCTTAPLSGALLYVAQSGDLLTGAVTLYALALGMGIPLILMAVFGNKLLPKAGAWMEKIKTFFGFVLLAAPLFFLERLLPENISAALWLLWLFISSAWLYHHSRSLALNKIATAFSIIAILGLSISATQGYQLIFQPQIHQQQTKLPFIQISTVEDLERELEKAKSANKAVMLDFYADWCVACKEYEKYTFSNELVTQKLADFVLLQADVTQNNQQNTELLNRLQILVLPTIDFWNTKGEFVAKARLSGFMNAEDFLSHIATYQL